MKRPQISQDKIFWELASHNGKLAMSSLRHRMKIKQKDLDSTIDDLVNQGRGKGSELADDKRGQSKQLIALIGLC